MTCQRVPAGGPYVNSKQPAEPQGSATGRLRTAAGSHTNQESILVKRYLAVVQLGHCPESAVGPAAQAGYQVDRCIGCWMDGGHVYCVHDGHRGVGAAVVDQDAKAKHAQCRSSRCSIVGLLEMTTEGCRSGVSRERYPTKGLSLFDR